jgi:hypothetical protein
MTNPYQGNVTNTCDDMVIVHKEHERRSKRITITKYLAPLKDFTIIKLNCNGTHRVNLD